MLNKYFIFNRYIALSCVHVGSVLGKLQGKFSYKILQDSVADYVILREVAYVNH